MDQKLRKQQLRKEIRHAMANLTAEYNQTASRKIQEWLYEIKPFQEAETIFCFVSTPEEIDTHSIIEYAWACGKRVAVPRCLTKGIMEACVIKKKTDLEEGKFGILEPKTGCEVLKPEQIQFVVLPCLSCDRKGNRLGYGGGYYDRYLEKCSALRAVLCREKLMLEEIPAEPFDQKPDFLVTEKGVFPIDR